ncbi:MAG: 2-phosphosulfolactate phosphatase [Bacillota bacterium]
MKYKILHLIEGAKNARGLTVVIDVFRAFSTAAYLFANGAERIIPVAKVETAHFLKSKNPGWILLGERKGKKIDGFDYGNSPFFIKNIDFTNKTIIHTSTNGTQGIANARYAKEIITGSFVNARAIADYIKLRNPENVSFVCMGNANVDIAEEDLLCAEYIISLLDNKNAVMEKEIINKLRISSGKRFFDTANKDWAPKEDFDLCLDFNHFPFVLRAESLDLDYNSEDINEELNYLHIVFRKN